MESTFTHLLTNVLPFQRNSSPKSRHVTRMSRKGSSFISQNKRERMENYAGPQLRSHRYGNVRESSDPVANRRCGRLAQISGLCLSDGPLGNNRLAGTTRIQVISSFSRVASRFLAGNSLVQIKSRSQKRAPPSIGSCVGLRGASDSFCTGGTPVTV